MQKNTALEKAVYENEAYIKTETLTNELIFKDKIENGIEIEFDDIKTVLTITK